jgi:hypothetical protein
MVSRTVSRSAIGGFWRLLQQQLGELLGRVGEVEALAGAVVEFVGDGASCAWLMAAKSVPLGKYGRSRPLVFSLEPRCHGACGSQKKTSMPASMWTCFQSR